MPLPNVFEPTNNACNSYVFTILGYQINDAEPSEDQLTALENTVTISSAPTYQIDFDDSIVSIQSPGSLTVEISVNIDSYLSSQSFQFIQYTIQIDANECYPLVPES